jgi:parvulin-like peptidyl-prolyl isomerase
VAERVSVNGEQVRAMYDSMYGPRRQVRLITVPDLASAHAAIVAVKDGASFTDVATVRSTDVSASRGGLLEPMSRNDTSYPASLRGAVWSLSRPGEMSNPVLLDDNYAVVQFVGEEPPSGRSFSSERARMERLVRMGQERLLMDQLANRIITDASVTIFDESLRDSWRRSRRR